MGTQSTWGLISRVSSRTYRFKNYVCQHTYAQVYDQPPVGEKADGCGHHSWRARDAFLSKNQGTAWEDVQVRFRLDCGLWTQYGFWRRQDHWICQCVRQRRQPQKV